MVEDIEGLNFEEYGRYEEQQKDWRFVLEEVAAQRYVREHVVDRVEKVTFKK